MKLSFKKIICFFVCALLVSALPMAASADMGPKPSVRVEFKNMGSEVCYGTLLSKAPSTGPHSVWNENEDPLYFDPQEDLGVDEGVWRAFVEYKDSDGFYFLKEAIWQVSEKGELAWTYYPPETFKILLYYPETQRFAVSGIYEKYAFDTYYTVDMNGVEIGSVTPEGDLSGENELIARKSYKWKEEAISLVARILITIAIEMGVALLFGFREKSVLVFLMIVNATTQVILNVLLNIINFRSGGFAFVFGYIVFEFAVFFIEAVLYSLVMKKYVSKAKPAVFYILYALAANAVSFGAGFVISCILPGIF